MMRCVGLVCDYFVAPDDSAAGIPADLRKLHR
jgi:hypothetical protein